MAKRSKPEESLTPFINVPSAVGYPSKTESNGGKVTQPRMAIPGVGYMVVFEDTENNRLGLIEEYQSAR